MKITEIISLYIMGILSFISTVVEGKNEMGSYETNRDEGIDITVQVNNIDRTKPGNILVMLYAKDGFPKDHDKALKIETIPAVVDQMSISFSSVPGEFAIKILHDEDENGQVTKNWTGIFPAEGLGFSNGAKITYRAPRFNEAKLNLSQVFSPLTIDLIYP